MNELSVQDLKRMFLESVRAVKEKKEEINRINVFPVPDQDTGDNLFHTLEGARRALEGREFQGVEEMSSAILDGVLESAQGNIGVILTGFFIGFLSKLKNPINISTFAQAFEEGRRKAWRSMVEPKKGTVLDVIDASSDEINKNAKEGLAIVDAIKKGIEKAKEALLDTRNKMEILKKAGVVDAGGLGFLIIMESWLSALTPGIVFTEIEKEERTGTFFHILSYRYEVIGLISNFHGMIDDVKKEFKQWGDCIDIVQIRDKVKIHIHTNEPQKVKRLMERVGEIENIKIEDMSKNILGVTPQNVSIGIVTEDVSTIPLKIKERYRIEFAHALLHWPEIDKIPGENIWEKVRNAPQYGVYTLPKTAQAPPSSYLNAFKLQLERFQKVLCFTISSQISGCYNSAIQARGMLAPGDQQRIFIVDTKHAAASEALLILKAIELIEEGKDVEAIIRIIEEFIPKTHLILSIQDPKYIESIGRITHSQAQWIRRMKRLWFHPLMEFRNGKIEKGGIVFGSNEAIAIFKKIKREKKNKTIRVVINHCDNPSLAMELKKLLKSDHAEVSYVSDTPPIFVAAGPGSIICGWQEIN